jgi:molybdopterin/thiamine biosynthesis adenylyltransferase
MGVFAPLVGIVGSLQAAEALKLLVGTGTPLTGALLMLDARSMAWDRIAVARRADCSVCGVGGVGASGAPAASVSHLASALKLAR